MDILTLSTDRYDLMIDPNRVFGTMTIIDFERALGQHGTLALECIIENGDPNLMMMNAPMQFTKVMNLENLGPLPDRGWKGSPPLVTMQSRKAKIKIYENDFITINDVFYKVG